MITSRQFPTGAFLLLIALPAILLGQAPMTPNSALGAEAPYAPPPPPEVIPSGISAEVWRHALAAHR